MPAQPPLSPIRPTDDQARSLARQLLQDARFAALGVLDPDSGAPMVSRIALALSEGGEPMTLVSDLSHHTRALRADPRASVLVGEPGEKGDPLTHPRITLMVRAAFLDRADPTHAARRARYLDQHPKAQLYIDFADFNFVQFQITQAHLNGGFGKAYTLDPDDLRAP